MKVTKSDIYLIKPGTSMAFRFHNYESMKSIQVYAYQLSYASDKPEGVLRYKTSANRQTNVLTIEAVRRES